MNGVKYLAIKADARSIYGKKGEGGVICVLIEKVLLIGIYDKNLRAGDAASIMENLADQIN